MGKREKIRILETDLAKHPAFLAWRELHHGNEVPERIEILKGKTPEHRHSYKRFACRLVGVGMGGASVIGKRCRRQYAEIESKIYKEILPHIPITSPKYYGKVEDGNGYFNWLFLEDAGEEIYSETDEEHRQLSARWLALMHTSASQIGKSANLPTKGSKHYLERLQKTRKTISETITEYCIQGNNLSPFETILTQLDILEANWDQIEELCRYLPQTLVHGDYVSKNIRIRSNHTGKIILPFDWAEAGWGSPSTDIRKVNINEYWSIVRDQWPWLRLKEIKKSEKLGQIFRSLDAIHWGLSGFNNVYLNNILVNLRIYEITLVKAINTGIIKC